MSGNLWLDDMVDAGTYADIAQRTSNAADRDASLRKLMAGASLLRHAVERAVAAALHVDPLQCLADGWATADDIRAFKNAGTPGQPVVLRLGAHRIERDLKPGITVDLGARRRFDLDMALTLAGAFEGIEISIVQGKLVSLGAGTCSLSLCVKVAGEAVTPDKTLKSLHLPAEYTFLQPVPIY